MSEGSEQPSFPEWTEKFFAYLTKQRTNVALSNLIECLGDEGRLELALSVFNFLRTNLWREFCAERRKRGQGASRKIDRLIGSLKKSAAICRQLESAAPELGPGTLLGAGAPAGFADVLESEATRLTSQRERIKIAFRKKRMGIKEDLGNLYRLQIVVEQFVLRCGDSWPKTAATRLSAADLADLLEAGKAAFGVPETETLTDPASVERALSRFRKHPDNRVLCDILTQNAIATAARIPLNLPALLPRT